jgi:rSAM/selenodomain-associated transferase 1
MSAATLVVMAKHPTPGAVKTRLAAALGADVACALYAAFLADLAARLRDAPWPLVWAVAPPGADLRPFVGVDARQIAQEGTTLSARMWHCVAHLFGEGAERVLMIGADAPQLDVPTLASVDRALDTADAAFIPTHDGGYCAVGLRAPHDLFTPITMGNAGVFAATEARLRTLGLTWRVLAESFDVDEPADLAHLAALIGAGTIALPHTAAVLGALRAGGARPI